MLEYVSIFYEYLLVLYSLHIVAKNVSNFGLCQNI